MNKAIEGAHPVVNGDGIGGMGFVRGDFSGREPKGPFRPQVSGDLPEYLLRTVVRRRKEENWSTQAAGERRDQERPRSGGNSYNFV